MTPRATRTPAVTALIEASREVCGTPCQRVDVRPDYCLTCHESMPCRVDDLRSALAAVKSEDGTDHG